MQSRTRYSLSQTKYKIKKKKQKTVEIAPTCPVVYSLCLPSEHYSSVVSAHHSAITQKNKNIHETKIECISHTSNINEFIYLTPDVD